MPAFEWPFIFNVLVVLFVQEPKPALLFQKNLKQEAWSKASCSFLDAYQIQGVVTNGAAGCFISMHECVFPSIVRTCGKKRYECLGLCNLVIMSYNVWKDRSSVEVTHFISSSSLPSAYSEVPLRVPVSTYLSRTYSSLSLVIKRWINHSTCHQRHSKFGKRQASS